MKPNSPAKIKRTGEIVMVHCKMDEYKSKSK